MENLENQIEKAGGFGCYQILLMALSVIPLMFVAANMGASIFVAMIPKVKCINPSAESYLQQYCPSNYSTELANLPDPIVNKEHPYCSRFDFTSPFESNNSLLNETEICNLTDVARISNVVQCDDWTFDRNVMKSTVVTEFDLVCDHIWAGYVAQSALMLGVGVGSIITGLISDKGGRRMAFLISCIGTTIFGIIESFTTSYISYCAVRFFLGLFVFGSFPVLFVLDSEMTVLPYRSLVAQILELSFPLGFILLSLISFALRDWRQIQLAISAPFVFGVVMWWFLPESPRWLYHSGKEEDAYRIITQISTVNRSRADDCEEEEPVEAPPKYVEVDTTATNTDVDFDEDSVLKRPFLRGACFKLFFNWFAISCVYYGLTLNAADLGEDPFAILCLNSIAEMVAVILTVPLVNRVGRRITGFLSESTAGLLCIAVVFMPRVLVPVAILGKFAISIAFSTMYIHTNEIYPTPIRTSGLGICNAMGRLGGVLSPIISLLKTEMAHLPYIAFGVLSMIAGALVLTLPETRCTRLPQTIEEGENFISSDRGVRNRCKRPRELG